MTDAAQCCPAVPSFDWQAEAEARLDALITVRAERDRLRDEVAGLRAALARLAVR